MRISIKVIPHECIDQCQLHKTVKNGVAYFEIIRGVYDLPEAGILANRLLKKFLPKFGYHESDHTLAFSNTKLD